GSSAHQPEAPARAPSPVARAPSLALRVGVIVFPAGVITPFARRLPTAPARGSRAGAAFVATGGDALYQSKGTTRRRPGDRHMARRTTGTAEGRRLEEAARRKQNWQRWGPYLSERQWGTVREDYSPAGNVWGYLPGEQARSRASRWGEDGLLGIPDRQCRLCFALALWNGADPILKERLFGLTGPEGNHGEDVKECYFYLDSTP